MKARITETIEYEFDIPEGVAPTTEAVEQWFVQQDSSKLQLSVQDRTIEIVTDAWKIQAASANGWADIKESEDGETYWPSHYDSKEEAEDEMRLLASSGEFDSWRVVPASTPQDDELYD